MGASEEGTRQDEGANIWSSRQLPLHSGHMMIEAIDIVHIPMFNLVVIFTALVQIVSWHGHLRPIEDTWLIHIVPSVEIWPVVGIVIHPEKAGPELSGLWIAEIWVG